MISRRDIIKGIVGGSVAPVPALAPAAADVPAPAPLPAPAPASKVTDTKVTKLKFRLPGCSELGTDDRELDVRIAPAARWEGAKKANKLSCAGWEAQHLPDGRVLTVRQSPRPRNDCGGVIPGDPPYTEAVIALQRLRSVILAALEASPDVLRISMTSGGDGQACFDVSVRDPDVAEGAHESMHHLEGTFVVKLAFAHGDDQAW